MGNDWLVFDDCLGLLLLGACAKTESKLILETTNHFLEWLAALVAGRFQQNSEISQPYAVLKSLDILFERRKAKGRFGISQPFRVFKRS